MSGSNNSKSELDKLNELLKITSKSGTQKNDVNIDTLIEELKDKLSSGSKKSQSVKLNLKSGISYTELKEKVLDFISNVVKIETNNQCELRDIIQNKPTCSQTPNDFKSTLDVLKKCYEEIKKEIKSRKECKDEVKDKALEALNKYIYLLDTCYDASKAEKLKEATEDLKNKLDNNFTHFIPLAAAVTYLKAKGKLSDKSEWFYEVVRAALSNDKFKFPYCPWLGDAVTLLYYYLVESKGKQTGSITVNTIINIVKRLLQ